MAADAKTTVKGIQTILSVVTGSPLGVDGIAGRNTRNALKNAPDYAISAITAYANSRGHDLKELMEPKAVVRKVSGSLNPQHAALMDKYAKLFKVHPQWARVIAGIESNFDPSAISPTGAAGLFQVTQPAIRDVQRSPLTRAHYFESPDGTRTHPEWNIMCGIGYLRICASYMGVDATSARPEVWADIYGCYNLGVGAYKLWKRGRFDASDLLKAWGVQSSELRQNGIEQYRTNVLAKLEAGSQAIG